MMAAVAMFAAFAPTASASEPESPVPSQNVVGVPSSAEPELNSDSQLPSGTAEQPKVEDPGTEEPTVPTGPVTLVGSDIAVETTVSDGYSYENKVLTISESGDYTLSMAIDSVGSTGIKVTDAFKSGTITLSGLNLSVSNKPGIDVDEGAIVTLKLVGENTITSSQAAIRFPGATKNHVITSDKAAEGEGYDGWAGSLSATTTNDGWYSAIGGNMSDSATSVVISGGKITANGNIGAGLYTSNTIVDITDGFIDAKNGITGYDGSNSTATISVGGGVVAVNADDGPAVGGGDNNIITISGGTVTASSSDGPAIGGGNGQTATITISGGTVNASSSATNFDAVVIGAGLNEDATVNLTGGTVTVESKQNDMVGIGSVGNGVGNVTIDGANVTITLTGNNTVAIGAGSTNGRADVAMSSGDVNIKLTGDGAIGIGGHDNREGEAIDIDGGTISIDSTGAESIGIGGSDKPTVDINDGSVNVTVKGTDSVGIGGTSTFGYGKVNISGGAVTTTATQDGAVGIGGLNGSDVTITGGVVKAAGDACGIGDTGTGPYETNFSTTDAEGNPGNAVIKSNTPIKDQTGRDDWSGVIFEGKNGTVHGTPAPPSFTIESDETLTIPDGSELILGKDTTVTNNGSIKVEGSGNVSGGGKVDGTTGSKAEVDPTEDNLPDLSKLNLTYDGSNHMDTVTEKAIVSKNSVEGGLIHTFPSDWKVSVWKDGKQVTEVKDAGEYEVQLTKGKTTLVNPAKVTVKKAASTVTTKPAVPAVDKDKSVKTTVVLTTEAKNVEYQARKASDKDWPDKWQDSPTFSNLAAKTEYQFRLRDKGDKNHEPSQPSDAVTHTTGEAPAPTPGGGGSGGGGAVTPSKGLEISSKPAKSEYAYGDKLDLTGLVVTDASGKKLDAAEYTVSGYRSDKPGVQKVTVALKEDPKQAASFEVLVMFRDVNEMTPHHEEIRTILERDITRGFDDGTFRGMSTLNRQDLAAFLYRLAGQPDYEPTEADFVFVDVTTATPHYREILWAAKQGVIRGFEAADGTRTFAGGRDILRQDMVAMLWRLAGSPAAKDGVSFSDVTADTPHCEAIAWAKAAGVTTGFPDGTFRGGSTIVRQDTAAFLGRMIDKNLVKL